ncbi:rod shape-determining protein MreB [bacterium]|nr:rod shape-determining protein MreB [bacterium]
MNTGVSENRQRIWAIGGGKGGVGKSLLATNLSIILAELGHNVIAIDLDLGNANLHTGFGIKYPRQTLMDFLSGDVQNLNEILLDTSVYNLKFISGAGGIIGSANPWYTQKLKLMRYIEKLHADHIVLDLGAGTSYNIIDFFIGATDHIIITTPESPSIQSAFNFIRICVFRKLHSIIHSKKKLWGVLEKAKVPNLDGGIIKLKSVLEEMEKIEPASIDEFREFQQTFKPFLILNMIMKAEETKLGWGIKEVIKQYLDIDIQYAGSISFDNIIRESLSSEIPYIINAPKARPTTELFTIIPYLLGNNTDSKGIRDIIQRQVKRMSKTYNTRVVESAQMDVDPSIYVVDKVKRVESDTQKDSDGFFSFKASTWSKIAIDLGTSNTRIFVKGRGVVLNEPSLMSLDETTGKIVALGYESKAMLGRSHSGINIVAPMESGAISDYNEVKLLIQEFIKLAKRSTILIRPGVVLTIPPKLTHVEKRAVQEFIKEMGAREVHLVYEPLAAAIGSGLPVDIPKASMLVDIGGGSVSALVVSISGIVGMESERIGGNAIDNAIVRYLREVHNFYIGNQTAEWIKINFGQAYKIGRDKRFEIRGQDIEKSIPRTMYINTGEIREAISKPVNSMLKVIMQLLENVPPELSGDLVDRGMTLTGGGSLLAGLNSAITERSGIKVRIAPNAKKAAVEGAGRMLDDFKFYAKFFVDDIEDQKL